jgi:predicted metalloprotease
MRWADFRRSDNVEDNRAGGGRIGGGMPIGRGGLGIGTIIVLGLIGWAFGIDPRLLIGGAELISGGGPQYEQPRPSAPMQTGAPSDRTGQFVAAVLGDTEDAWKAIFQASGQTYREPKLRLFARVEQSACGFAQSAMGPFYCPIDQRVYLDTAFFEELQTRFRGCPVGSTGCEFAQAYVIAHEVGHHVQNLLGILPRVRQQQEAMASKAQQNQLQVMVELQADCFAGVWAHHSRERWKSITEEDLNAALQTASATGDDTLQRRSQGYVVPDAFTHGSAEQRKRWFMTGLNSGAASACNTFAAAQQ